MLFLLLITNQLSNSCLFVYYSSFAVFFSFFSRLEERRKPIKENFKKKKKEEEDEDEDENEETVNDPDEIAKNLGGDSVFLDLLALSIEKIVKKR